MNLRQSILVRTDLNLPLGLMCAQVAHIHYELVRRNMDDKQRVILDGNPLSPSTFAEWNKDPFLFVHAVPNQEALLYFIELARGKNIKVTTWDDTIYLNLSPTQQRAFEGVLIGCALGPAGSDQIKAVIGDLPLL